MRLTRVADDDDHEFAVRTRVDLEQVMTTVPPGLAGGDHVFECLVDHEQHVGL
ncbi:hypothetical protein [Skermania sp. ID1734]|uniref:hypothetical protein n=1 Tax=Skermania sp. ID1734 TaxID=2597516 RepID=UPI00163D71D5|nr:hypothetical protein [Skermania sp. ID1734]